MTTTHTETDNLQPIVDKAKAHQEKGTQDFSDVYKDIVQLQQKDKNPAHFADDMKELNNSLHQAGILKDVQITGVDGSDHFLATQDGKQVDVVASNISDTFQPGTEKQSWWKGAENVAGEVLKGAGDEIMNHPLHLVEAAAIGFAVGAAAIGVAAIAPVVATAAAVGGIAYAGVQVATHIEGWAHDAEVVADPQAYSANEVATARQGAEAFGAGGTDVLAGVFGGIAGGMAGNAVKTAIVARMANIGGEIPPEVPPDANTPEDTDGPKSSIHHAHAQQGNIANATGSIGDPSHAVNGGIQIDHSHAVAGLIQGDPTDGSEGNVAQPVFNAVDSHSTVVAGNDVPPPAADAPLPPPAADAPPPPPAADAPPPPAADATTVTTPKDVAAAPADGQAEADAAAKADAVAKEAAAKALEVEKSVANSQSIFRDANSDPDSAVISAQKQDYNVRFTKVLEPGKVPTLENPAGADVNPGDWVATRLNPDGTPNIERGMTNQWTVTPKNILKTYKATPDDLNTNSFIAGTKTDGPPVHMVQLDKPFTIKTPWGQMSGGAHDWLANYDYNPATGQPGTDYAIVTNQSFGQTYEPTTPKTSS
jgi:hypothetical protein